MKISKTYLIAGALASLLLAGCVGDMLTPKPDPTAFYVLSTPKDMVADPALKSDISVTIMPVSIPPYMDRSQIVTLGEGNRVSIAEYQRWIELPAASLGRLMTQNISILSGNANIFTYPAVAFSEKYIWVRIYVSDCIGKIGGELSFKARWQLVDVNGKDELTSKDFAKSYPAGDSYDSYVSAINAACADLSKDIALGIKTFEKKAEDNEKK